MKKEHIRKFLCDSCKYIVKGKRYCKHGGKQGLKSRCSMKKGKI